MTATTGWTWAPVEPGSHALWRSGAGRGVGNPAEAGYRFSGREAALGEIISWLSRPEPDRRALVVTGQPGAGKSAVLDRIVMTARGDDPADGHVRRAALGSVACAVHAAGRTAEQVMAAIGRAAGIAPADPYQFTAAMRAALAGRNLRFNIVIDAVEEARPADEVGTILRQVVRPLVVNCFDVGVQVVLGCRRRHDRVDLIKLLGPFAKVIDLDSSEYFNEEDLYAYVLRSLRLEGAERADNPYLGPAAIRVAERITELAKPNFLIGGFVARIHGMSDLEAVSPDDIAFSNDMLDLIGDKDSYLRRLPDVGPATAEMALTVLAFAEEPGLTFDLWLTALQAVNPGVTRSDLLDFCQSSAANFLALSTETDPYSYRLIHRALGEALLQRRAADVGEAVLRADRELIVRAFMELGERLGWASAPRYLLRSLATHAESAGIIDELLLKDEFLFHADLDTLLIASRSAVTERGRARSRVLGMCAPVRDLRPSERGAVFAVSQLLERVDAGFAESAQWPFRGRWAVEQPRLEHAVLAGHESAVTSVAVYTVGSRAKLATGGDDGKILIWDLESARPVDELTGHTDRVRAVRTFRSGDQWLIASAGNDATVRLWNPSSGECLAVLRGHDGWIRALCTLRVLDELWLASAGDDGTVRLWDPTLREGRRVLRGHKGSVGALCEVTVAGRRLLASAGNDATVRLWDVVAGHTEMVLRGETRPWLSALCPLTVAGRTLLAVGSYDTTVRVYDLEHRRLVTLCQGHTGWIHDLVEFAPGQFASASHDGTVRLWRWDSPESLGVFDGHQAAILAVGTVSTGVGRRLASAGEDRTARVWDVTTATTADAAQARTAAVNDACFFAADGYSTVAIAGDDGEIQICDSATGDVRTRLVGHDGAVLTVAPVRVGRQPLLASGSDDGTVRLWDPFSRRPETVLNGHKGWARAVCQVEVRGEFLIASAGDDRTILLWDPVVATGPVAALDGDAGWVLTLCSWDVGRTTLLASGAVDRGIRLWDPTTKQLVSVLSGHSGSVHIVRSGQVEGRSLLFSGDSEGTIHVWAPDTPRPVTAWPAHAGAVRGLCLVAGNTLVSCGDDRLVKLWDLSGSVTLRHAIPVQRPARACARDEAGGGVVVALGRGVLVLDGPVFAQ